MTIKITPAFRLIERIEDEATGNFSSVIEYRAINGRTRQIQIAAAEVAKKHVLRDHLRQKGAQFWDNEDRNNRALEQLRQPKGSVPVRKLAATTGWRSEKLQTYVHPWAINGK